MNPASRLATALSDRYRIERELGAGGMATVYLAHDLKHDRDVAIKVLHQDLAAALGAERFLAEIKTTAKLQHPHILPLLDSGEAAGLLYYVMPYLKGESLRDRLNREKQLPIEDAVRIAREVADALGHAHGHEVIHRDIKPENILLQEGHALVADFGIALAVQSAGGQRMTQTGLSLGTPQYMSPEQAMGEKAIDARADIYALGAVTYEMLTGEPPFTGATVQAIVARVMSEEPRPITSVRKTVPAHVDATVRTALEKLPADRFATAAQFMASLTNERVVPARRAAQRLASGKALRATAVGAVLVAAVSLALLSKGQLQKNTPDESVALSITLPDSLYLLPQPEGQIVDISADGHTVVFAATTGKVSRAYYRRLDDTTLHAIPGSENIYGLLISPDARSIAAFIGAAGETKSLRILPLDGTAGVKLLDDPALDASWRTADRILMNSRDGRELRSVPPSSKPSQLLRVLRPAAAIAPEDLPGGTWILAHLSMPLRRGQLTFIGVVSPTTGESRALTRRGLVPPGSANLDEMLVGRAPRYFDPGFIAYTRFDGTLMLVRFNLASMRIESEARPVMTGVQVQPYYATAQYALSKNGTMVYVEGPAATSGSFRWISADGNTDSLPIPAGAYYMFQLSRDGRRLATLVHTDGASELAMFDVATGMRTRIPEAAPWWSPAWGPDGNTLFHATSDGWIKRRAASDLRVLDSLRTDGSDGVQDVSPDGRTVLVQRWQVEQNPGLFFVSWPDGRRTTLTADTTAAFGNFSPDGKWVVYARADGSQPDYAVYVAPVADPSRASRVQGGYTPVWSRDGKSIFFGEGWRVWQVSRQVERFGAPKLVYDGPFLVAGNVIAVGPDGRILLALPKPQKPRQQIRVITNWLAKATAQLAQ